MYKHSCIVKKKIFKNEFLIFGCDALVLHHFLQALLLLERQSLDL